MILYLRQNNTLYINNFQLISGQEEHYVHQGKEAKKAILNRLSGWPKAGVLAAEICNFYGDCLHYYENSIFESSHYHIKMQHDPIAIQYARIELQLGTLRTAEALCHELLHLNTRICGYPFGEKFFIPFELSPYASAITGFYPKIGNLLEHELFLKEFINLGFDKNNFLGSISPPPDYEKLASAALNSIFYRKEIGFSWWCLEYFRHWISTRHWIGDEPGIYADYALFWGSRVHSSMRRTVKEIMKLIESGSLLDKNRHHHYVNKLLELMRIPKFTEWAFIRNNSSQGPLAFRMTEKVNLKPDSPSPLHVPEAIFSI